MQGHKVLRIRNLRLFDRIVVLTTDGKWQILGSSQSRDCNRARQRKWQFLIECIHLRQASIQAQSHGTGNELSFGFIGCSGCIGCTRILR